MKIDFSKKDFESFFRHDSDYIKTQPAFYKKNFVDMNIYQQFDLYGYRAMVENHPEVRSLHIDLGCGGGWLLEKTAPYFKRVVGVDPSAAALAGASEVTKHLSNVELIEGDMVEVLQKLNFSEPIFLTTTTVLSHINDEWVSELLKIVNNLPKGSILTFGEPHGKNIQRKLWYIRDKEWWANRLNNWQLVFNDQAPFGYNYSIVGMAWGKDFVLERHKKRLWEKIIWRISGAYYFARNFLIDRVKTIIKII